MVCAEWNTRRDTAFTNTATHLPAEISIKNQPPYCPPPFFFGMGNVKRKYMHTVIYKWLLVTGSLHVRNIKVRLALKSYPRRHLHGATFPLENLFHADVI